MSLYGHSSLLEEAVRDTEVNLTKEELKPFIELAAYEDISRGTDAQRKAFCESKQAQVLVEKQVLNKSTMMRLSKEDDQKRRIKLNAYMLAKKANDKDYVKMLKYRNLWKEYRNKVLVKYGKKAERVSKVAQQEYIKAARKES